MARLKKDLLRKVLDEEDEEEDEESLFGLFSKWISQKLKSGKKRLAEVE